MSALQTAFTYFTLYAYWVHDVCNNIRSPDVMLCLQQLFTAHDKLRWATVISQRPIACCTSSHTLIVKTSQLWSVRGPCIHRAWSGNCPNPYQDVRNQRVWSVAYFPYKGFYKQLSLHKLDVKEKWGWGEVEAGKPLNAPSTPFQDPLTPYAIWCDIQEIRKLK